MQNCLTARKPKNLNWVTLGLELLWPVIAVCLVGYGAHTMISKRVGYRPLVEADTIDEMLRGNVLKTEQFSFYYAPSGFVYGRIGSQADRGTWTVEDQGYCEHWLVWGEGQKICWAVERKGKFVRRTGKSVPSYKQVPVVNELVWMDGEHLR